MTGPVAAGSAANGVPELDPVIHAQARLRVTVALAALGRDERITFPRLRQLLDMTAGNLSIHLRKLEEAGYVDIVKTHERRTPVTFVALTTDGRAAFARYTAALQSLLAAGAPPDGNGDRRPSSTMDGVATGSTGEETP